MSLPEKGKTNVSASDALYRKLTGGQARPESAADLLRAAVNPPQEPEPGTPEWFATLSPGEKARALSEAAQAGADAERTRQVAEAEAEAQKSKPVAEQLRNVIAGSPAKCQLSLPLPSSLGRRWQPRKGER